MNVSNAVPADGTMRAIVATAPGEALVLASRPVPALAPGQVLVRVVAAGLNPLDVKIRHGQAAHAQRPLPATLGIDVAGVVAALAPDVQGFTIGDHVFGMVGGVGDNGGTLAEYVAADARLLAVKPAALSWEEAAVLPLVTITAWEGLVDRARVKAGDTVLVHGGAGGVGHIAVQIAKAFGATVWATGTSAQRAVIETLGAQAIDHEAEPVDAYVARATGGEGFDIVYDTVGGPVIDASFRAVRTYHGHVVSALGWGTHSLAPLSFRGATYSGVFTLLPLLTGRGREHHGEILRAAAGLAARGLLRPMRSPHAFDLAQAEQAYARLASPQNVGKIAVTTGYRPERDAVEPTATV